MMGSAERADFLALLRRHSKDGRAATARHMLALAAEEIESMAHEMDGLRALEEPAVDPRLFSITKAAYTFQEAADLLSVSVATIYREINDGKLTRTKKRGRALLLAPDLIDYITQPNA